MAMNDVVKRTGVSCMRYSLWISGS